MTDRIGIFRLANQHSPIVMSEWLDANKRSPKGPPETWEFRRIQLEDGTTFVFTREEASLLGSYDEHWWSGIDKPPIQEGAGTPNKRPATDK